MISIYSAVDSLVKYAVRKELIDERDSIYARNAVLEILDIHEYKKDDDIVIYDFEIIKKILIDYAREKSIITSSGSSFEDNFIAKIMNVFIKFPSQIEEKFYKKYKESPRSSTDYFYELSKATDYIKTARLENNVRWNYDSDYGELVLTINLAKPEKTPEEIILAQQSQVKKYPKCVLCKENEGLSGINRAPRQNHRIIAVNLDSGKHYFQYSPYSYFNEHCIVLTDEHKPMNLDINSVKSLLSFVDMFDHYFICSNADLPLVGGSILSHEHYQGGNFMFPLDKAEILKTYSFNDVSVEKLKWPMSSVRIKSVSKKSLLSFIEILLNRWKNYSNVELGIISHTGSTRHNALNYVVRKNNGEYSVIVVFRNNRCSEEHPNGIFTTKDEYRNIKNENIGIIEVLGLAILPGRIREEIEDMKAYLSGGDLNDRSYKHREFLDKIKPDYNTEMDIDAYIKDKIGDVYQNILSNCSVFGFEEKSTKAFDDFIINVGKEHEKNNN